ncbi:hypothetical protein CFBP498_49440 (plasmid) [Xanthomonas hortorum pv. vitians]|uniref:Uncharacterized protein n=1 Tax=Xanthomonas hortorum pv. vitians TaxID=83224 RepID=A0A6V7FJN2_9XANT|nr:hypothetical protein CFBP498_49440 [Xanthomonas hortorum pv. vitians]CAD0363783.1 hypothetical protein CFBP498_49440 [Xanthomonas hortorum pv. vitians]
MLLANKIKEPTELSASYRENFKLPRDSEYEGICYQLAGRKDRGLACETSGRRRLSGGSDLRPPTMAGEVALTTEKYCHNKTGSTISRGLIAASENTAEIFTAFSDIPRVTPIFSWVLVIAAAAHRPESVTSQCQTASHFRPAATYTSSKLTPSRKTNQPSSQAMNW